VTSGCSRDRESVPARIQLAAGTKSNVGLSGVAQQTLFEAFREHAPAIEQPDRHAAWLRRVFAHDFAEDLLKVSAEKRGRARALPPGRKDVPAGKGRAAAPGSRFFAASVAGVSGTAL
jgi:hypothetical protein